MTEPVLGSYYTFKYIGGCVYDPDKYNEEGMFVGRRGSKNIFATILPNREATKQSIQSVMLTYTDLGFQRIPHPSNKVIMTSETYYGLMDHLKSNRFKDPHDNGRVSPTLLISADSLLS